MRKREGEGEWERGREREREREERRKKERRGEKDIQEIKRHYEQSYRAKHKEQKSPASVNEWSFPAELEGAGSRDSPSP